MNSPTSPPSTVRGAGTGAGDGGRIRHHVRHSPGTDVARIGRTHPQKIRERNNGHGVPSR